MGARTFCRRGASPVRMSAPVANPAPVIVPQPRGWLWAKRVADVLFPPVCVGCGGVVEGGPLRHVCGACLKGIRFAPDGGGAVAAVWLGGAARELVHALKYRHARHVFEDIEAIIAGCPWLLEHVRGAVLVPVPLHARRQRERGFNQSRLIALAMARAAGGGTRAVPLLRRMVDTPPQAGLDLAGRRSNLKNAFALARGATLNPKLRHILVDDVFTTGSTLQACAEALRRAGGLNLDAAAFALG